MNNKHAGQLVVDLTGSGSAGGDVTVLTNADTADAGKAVLTANNESVSKTSATIGGSEGSRFTQKPVTSDSVRSGTGQSAAGTYRADDTRAAGNKSNNTESNSTEKVSPQQDDEDESADGS